MRWVFLLCLLVVAISGAVQGLTVAYRWGTSMQEDVKVVPGDLVVAQPPGTVPREGGELVVARELYAGRPNPVALSRESVATGGRLYRIYCSPCHGVSGKGDGPVTPRFIPPPDLGSPQIQGRTDGHLSHYIGYGGAVMPAYGEALSVTERWHLVNYIRSLAQR